MFRKHSQRIKILAYVFPLEVKMGSPSDNPTRILIAEDDAGSRRVLEASLVKLGFAVVTTADGKAAYDILQAPDAPRLALLDWVMPQMDGVEICKAIKAKQTQLPPYMILLTSKSSKDNIVEGLINGADDYITKPFNQGELRARLQAGCRILELQSALTDRIRQLEEALNQVKQLQGLLPICSYCKKIRDDQNYWQRVETYLCERTDVQFSHGICPECLDTMMSEIDEQERQEEEAQRRAEVCEHL